MDESTVTAAHRETAEREQLAIERLNRTKTYQVIVLGRNNNEPFPITASNAQERTDELAKAGVKRTDKWAAGYFDRSLPVDRQYQIAGNSDEAKALLRDHLRPKR